MLKTTRFAPQPDTPFGLAGTIARTALRTLQLITALVIAGIYGHDLQRATHAHEHADSRWVYAAVVAGLSVLAALALLVRGAGRLFAADAVLFFLWMVLFAVFGRLYIREDCEGSGRCRRMKVGVWFDLVGMLLWLGSFLGGAFLFWKERHSHSMFTGRAAV